MSFTQEESSFFESLRHNFFSDSDEFIKLITDEYASSFGEITSEKIQNNTSQILENLITLGKKKWDNIRFNIQRNWVENSLNNIENISKEFPNIAIKLNNLINAINNNKTNNEKIITVHQSIFDITSNFETSNRQAAKHLAGFTFEAYIKFFLKKLNYKFESQKEITQGEVLDFLYPNQETVLTNPSNCIVTECQSTLKDRFRLSLGKIPVGNPIDRYILTAGGIGIITNNDFNDLTENKVAEMREKGWKVVVFKKLKEEKFIDNPIVVTFEDFFNLYYPSKSQLW